MGPIRIQCLPQPTRPDPNPDPPSLANRLLRLASSSFSTTKSNQNPLQIFHQIGAALGLRINPGISPAISSDTWSAECKHATVVVFAHSAGDTICSECGLVLESHSIDETSEWRTFSNEFNYNDPVRFGGPYNPLLTDGGILHPDFQSQRVVRRVPLGKWQGRGANPDRNLINAFQAIAVMSDSLGLVTTIKVRANEIYKKVEDPKPLKGRNLDAILAACLYIACRQENKPRTVKEICSVANGDSKKEIGRAKEFIVKLLEGEMGQSVEMGTIHAADYMERNIRRFCSNHGMTNQEVKLAQEVVLKSEELDIRRRPISVASAVIYIITQLSNDKKPSKVA